MKKLGVVLFALAIVSSFGLNAQENNKSNKEEKKIIKIKKSTTEGDENPQVQTKIIVIKDGKVVTETVEGIEINSDDFSWSSHNDSTFAIFSDGDSTRKFRGIRMPAMRMRGVHPPRGEHPPMGFEFIGEDDMSQKRGVVKIFDFDKSDKDLKPFKAKQGRDIGFESIEISARGANLMISFVAPKLETEIVLKAQDGEKVYYKKAKSFEGEFNKKIPMRHLKPGVYLLEIAQGKANYLQKIIKE